MLRAAFLLAGVCAVSLVPASSADAQRRRPTPPAGGAPARGTLVIVSQNDGAQVFVDETLVGALPVGPQSLAPGDHTLRITQPGYTDFTEVFTIVSGQEAQVEVELLAISAILRVTTEPDGAQVFLDGRFAGETPLTTDMLEGEHAIRVLRAGHREVLRTVQAVAGMTEELTLTLEALPPELLTQNADDWYEQPLTWVAIGGGALLVATTIVLIAVLTAAPNPLEQYCGQSTNGCVRVMVSW